MSNIWNIFDDIKNTLDDNEVSTDLNNDINNDKNDTDNNNAHNNTNHNDNNIIKKINNDICYSCKSDALINENYILICQSCGIVNGEIIDTNQEWRYFGENDSKHDSNPSRCGNITNELLPDSSLGTIIYGKGLSKYKKANNWMCMNYKERCLLKVYKNIQSNNDDLNIPACVSDRAKLMFKKIRDSSDRKVKTNAELIAACVCSSLSDKNQNISVEEISKIYGITPKKLINGKKQFNELMFNVNQEYILSQKPITPEYFIEKYSKLLEIEQYNDKIMKIYKISNVLGIFCENNPESIAIACIYFVIFNNKLNISKKKISEISSLSEVTITKTFGKINKHKKYMDGIL